MRFFTPNFGVNIQAKDSFKRVITTNFEYIFSFTDIGAKLCCRMRELFKLLTIISGAMVALCDVNEYRHSIKLFKVRLHFFIQLCWKTTFIYAIKLQKRNNSNFIRPGFSFSGLWCSLLSSSFSLRCSLIFWTTNKQVFVKILFSVLLFSITVSLTTRYYIIFHLFEVVTSVVKERYNIEAAGGGRWLRTHSFHSPTHSFHSLSHKSKL